MKICIHYIWTNDQNVEILKVSAATETQFKCILKFGSNEYNICVLDHFASEPLNYNMVNVAIKWIVSHD